ncbi:MAG: hypothetical protein KF678_13905 [Phycisphaeraceae bacterium]|nr:hypothetical protein [Phycisphaeraceae bacterium]
MVAATSHPPPQWHAFPWWHASPRRAQQSLHNQPTRPPNPPPRPPPPNPLLELAFSHPLTPRDPASINGHIPVPESPLAALPDPSSTLIAIDPPTITFTDHSFTWSATLTFESGDRSRFHIDLALIENRWLITSLDHHMLNSG